MNVKTLEEAAHDSGKIGAGTLQKAQLKKLLRWIWEVTKVDRITNERYGIEEPKVGEIAMAVQDRMRNWYGHMVRRVEHCIGRMTMKMYGREEGLR